MHIVFLNVTGSLGGAERVLLTLLRELRALRPEWRLSVITGEPGPLLAAVQELNCEAECLPFPGTVKDLGDWGVTGKVQLFRKIASAVPSVWRYRTMLQQRLRALKPDIVQTNGFKMHLLGAQACPATARFIWHIHDFVSSRVAMRVLLRWHSNRPARIVAISEPVANDLRSVVRVPDRVRTILNSVDLSRWTLDTVARTGDIRIGLVATFARWKGHELFLKALALLPDDFKWRGLIVGGEVYSRAASQYTEAELRAITDRLGLAGKVEFTGFLADPAPVVETLDIVVHASTDPEPFGLTVAEAMAAGKAVITSSGSLVTHGENGLVFASGEAAALAEAIAELAWDSVLRSRLGHAAKITAQEQFRPERFARQFLDVYLEGA